MTPFGRSGRGPEALACEAVAAALADAGVAPFDVGQVFLGNATVGLLCGQEMIRPVNTGGGLLSRGHPVGATGCAQLVELTRQLRGRHANQVPRARLALAQNSGGVLGDHEAAVVVTISSGCNRGARARVQPTSSGVSGYRGGLIPRNAGRRRPGGAGGGGAGVRGEGARGVLASIHRRT
jgi:acetyl-CoA acetyltransferase